MDFHRIILPLPMGMGKVNAYLLRAGSGFVLIDTGGSGSRAALAQELERAGCQPGALRLIVLTHGDFDHSGNALHLRRVLGAQIAMHPGDAGMVERGDMFDNRARPNALIRALVPLFTGFGKAERFAPDLLLGEGDDLAAYGLDARALSIPGHSKGSIGVLTSAGELFCGDLLENMKGPVLNSLIDDADAARASLARLRTLNIGLVYPGHGEPFGLDEVAG